MRPPEDAAVDTELPPILRSLWRSVRLGYRADPWLLVISFAVTVGAALPDALFALGLRALVQTSATGSRRSTLVAALCLGGLAAGSWILKVGSERLNRRFADRSTVVIESHVAELQASIVTMAHQETPVLLDRLAMLRDQVFTLNHLYASLFTSVGTVLRLGLTLALLASVHPVLLLLGAAALPAVWVSGWRSGRERKVMERGAQDERLARHLFLLGTTAPPGKELRVARAEQRIRADRRAAWNRARLPVARARWVTSAWMAAGWALFGLVFSAGLAFVAVRRDASAGDVLLVLIAGTRLSQYVGLSITEVSFLRSFWLDASRRLAWLEDYAAAAAVHADAPVPDRLTDGIRLEGVSFRYPGTDRLVLDHVDLALPAGTVVAVVGENGAGKSTLVKLLCRFYDPTDGRILVDGVPLDRMPADDWRRQLTGSFQDFFRFELLARQSVGLGDLRRLDDEPAVTAAVTRGGATDVVERLPRGLATQLGPTWNEGVELSHGQWQKLALARGFMPEDTLLLVLDEPTSALDAETEHALFERYAAAAREDATRNGRITVLVSHRFSTVRMADLIVVLDGSRIIECGSHADLLAAGGRYAELYTIQATAYR